MKHSTAQRDEAAAVTPDAVEAPLSTAAWSLTGMAILDLGRSDRATVESLEPTVDVRAAADWGGLMDGTIEMRDEGVVWVPGEYAQRFGFVPFRLLSEDVVDIRVASRPSLRGSIDIDLADDRTVVVRVPDPERWRAELDRIIGA